MAAEVEDTLKRIEASPGVLGIVVVDDNGKVIRSTMDRQATLQYAKDFCILAQCAYFAVRDLDPQNDLQVLRVKTHGHEVLVAPDKDYTLIVVQSNHHIPQ